MNKYNLVPTNDANCSEPLEAATFQEAVEEVLFKLKWYIIDEGEFFVAVNDIDPNDVIELSEQIYEDAQYETIEKLGYFISTFV
jgi:hypothetical protein